MITTPIKAVVDSVIKAVSTLHTMFKDFPILVNERQKDPVDKGLSSFRFPRLAFDGI